jgi:hypothetical protein
MAARLMPKLIYVLGCIHGLQNPDGEFTSPEQRTQIQEYDKELKRISGYYRVDVICEEARHQDFTIAEQLAIKRRKSPEGRP